MSQHLSPPGGAAGARPPGDPVPAELRIALERGYLRPVQVKLVLARAAERNEPPLQALRELRFLSDRRLSRLLNHVRYRAMRKEGKRYARLVRSRQLASEADLSRLLGEQRRRFEDGRERVRLGALLVEAGLLTAEQDRALTRALARAASRRLAAA